MPPVQPEAAADDTVLPGEETPAEVSHDGFIAIDKHQKDVNVQHKKFRDEERGRTAAEQRANAAEARLAEIDAQNAEVVVPEPPDPYSDTYATDLAARDDAIRRETEQTAANAQVEERRQAAENDRQADENAVVQKRVADFDSNMVGHGLKPAEVKAAADAVIGMGISIAFQDVLLEDKDGPLLVQYLAANPVEADAMNRMSTLSLVNHLNRDVRAKALLLKPRTSDAPDPPITLEGGGAPETKESWEQGAKYE